MWLQGKYALIPKFHTWCLEAIELAYNSYLGFGNMHFTSEVDELYKKHNVNRELKYLAFRICRVGRVIRGGRTVLQHIKRELDMLDESYNSIVNPVTFSNLAQESNQRTQAMMPASVTNTISPYRNDIYYNTQTRQIEYVPQQQRIPDATSGLAQWVRNNTYRELAR